MPTVSICIPTYNGEKHLKQCIDSAIAQSYSDIEILLIDDASTDATWDIIASYAALDKRIKAYRNEQNIGLVGNFNKCIEKAGGKWIKFLLQDDYLRGDCLEIMMAGIGAHHKIAACKRTFFLDESIDDNKKKYYENGVVTFEKLGITSQSPVFIEPGRIATMAVGNICMNFIGEPTSVMFEKDVITEVGYFNTSLAQICDLEYFLRIASKYGIIYIPSPLSHFRIHGESATETNIQDKRYTLAHIDTIVTARQLLFDKCYSLFRSSLSFTQRIKLKLYFLVRVYESYQSALNNSAAINKFEAVSEKYPEISEYKRGSAFIKILLALIKIKRETSN
jgi:glycosyltransferase involved in cell wall biosynthesis